jgi:hypothetical protein
LLTTLCCIPYEYHGGNYWLKPKEVSLGHLRKT